MHYNEIKELTKWLEKSSFTTYSLTINGVSLSVSKQPHTLLSNSGHSPENSFVIPPQPILTQEVTNTVQENNMIEKVKEQPEGHFIHSPIVGIYYEGTSPESPAFVKVGEKVKKGDVLCILEAMKVMNEITADVDGVVAEILVSNGDMVEACMPLFRIEV